jgi:hypothetical protein
MTANANRIFRSKPKPKLDIPRFVNENSNTIINYHGTALHDSLLLYCALRVSSCCSFRGVNDFCFLTLLL